MNHLSFIGAGNMATSIIKGLLAQGVPAYAITGTRPRENSLHALHEETGIHITTDNFAAANRADVLILCVKPQKMREVCQQLKPALNNDCLIVSVAAGITTESLNAWLGADRAIVRCMPNTPAAVGLGANGLFANHNVNDQQKTQADALMNSIGINVWVDDESLIHAVTATSGSGPAYFFYMFEAMIQAGIEQGLDRQQATELTLQTALGAATLAQKSEVDAATLRERVTSPNGTTEQAIKSFEQAQLKNIIKEGMAACAERSVTLAEELG